MIYSVPNELGFPRLGLAVPRRVGTAVVRNKIKRRLREAFRHMQHDWPARQQGYDVVINVRPHEPMSMIEYQHTLSMAAQSLHATWLKKKDKQKRKEQRE